MAKGAPRKLQSPQTDSVTGARFPGTCYGQILALHCFGATGATIGAPFANQQILGCHCFRATGASSGPPLQRPLDPPKAPCKTNLTFSFLNLNATITKQKILGLHCFGATGATIGAPFANQQLLELHCNAIIAMQSLRCNL